VDHGPFLVDNNLFLSPTSVLDMSEGGAYVHNLFAGKITNRPEPGRETPYHPAHSTTVASLATIKGGDDRFYNNIFVGDGERWSAERKGNLKEVRWISSHGLWGYDEREFPLQTGGNVYLHGAEPYAREISYVLLTNSDPKLKLVQEDGKFILNLDLGSELKQARTTPVTTALLGKARIPQVGYENPDGSPLAVDRDFFGKKRGAVRPTPGPFEKPGDGEVKLRVW
jgi:hypothetical protein